MTRSACSHLFAAFLNHLTNARLAAEGAPGKLQGINFSFKLSVDASKKAEWEEPPWLQASVATWPIKDVSWEAGSGHGLLALWPLWSSCYSNP